MIRKISWLVVILTLVACGPAVIAPPTVTPNPSSTPAPTVTSTSAPTATSTPIAVTERCVEILPAFPESDVPSGALVISSLARLSLLNFRLQTERSISGRHFYAVSTSPNGKWLSYINIPPLDQTKDYAELIVELANGQKQTQVILDSDHVIYDWIPWLGNERIWSILDQSGVIVDPSTFVLDPFTGEGQVISPDYPGLAPFDAPAGGLWLHFGWSNVAYDPSLQLVVYPKKEDDGYYIALWNRETKQEIVKIPTSWRYGYLPLWFTDGSAFVVAAQPEPDKPPEWLKVSRDGEIRQLTHFGNLYALYGFGTESSLSPDGRYLAFGFHRGDPHQLRPLELVILDLQTLEAVNTCMTFNYFPIWSPDGRYLAVQHRDDNKKQNSVMVLDFEQGWAVAVFTDDKETNYRTYPRGWLDTGE